MNQTFETYLSENRELVGLLIKKYHLQSRFPTASPEELKSLTEYCLWKSFEVCKKKNFKHSVSAYFHFTLLKALKNDYRELFYYRVKTDPLPDIESNSSEKPEINFDVLTDVEHDIIRMRFYQNMTLAECGSILDRSYESIRQIEGKALNKLRQHAKLH